MEELSLREFNPRGEVDDARCRSQLLIAGSFVDAIPAAGDRKELKTDRLAELRELVAQLGNLRAEETFWKALQ